MDFKQLFEHCINVEKTQITTDQTNTKFFNIFSKKPNKPLFEHPQTSKKLTKHYFKQPKIIKN